MDGGTDRQKNREAETERKGERQRKRGRERQNGDSAKRRERELIEPYLTKYNSTNAVLFFTHSSAEKGQKGSKGDTGIQGPAGRDGRPVSSAIQYM